MNKSSRARQKKDCFWWSCAIVRTIVTNNLMHWKPIYVTKLRIRRGRKCLVARTVLHFPKKFKLMFDFLRGEYIVFAGCGFVMIFSSILWLLVHAVRWDGRRLLKTPKCLYFNDEIFRKIHIYCWNVVPTLIQMYVTVLLFTVEELWKLEGFRVQLDVNWTDIRSSQTRHVL